MGFLSKFPLRIIHKDLYNTWAELRVNADTKALATALIHLCYWPCSSQPQQHEARRLFELKIKELSPQYKHILSGGDFNCRVGAGKDAVTNAAGTNLMRLVSNLHIGHADLDYNLLTGDYSRIEQRTEDGKTLTQRSTPDHVFLSSPLAAICTGCRIEQECFGSDHLPITVDLSLTPISVPPPLLTPRWKFNSNDAKNLATALNEHNWDMEITHPSESAKSLAESINEIAVEIASRENVSNWGSPRVK